MDREKYHHGDLKRALVAEGMALLEEEGLAALSLRAIAKRVGVSHTAPRNHFGSLRGLLTAIGAEGFRLHAEEMRRGADGASPVRAALEGYVRFALERPELYKLMFSMDLIDRSDPVMAEAGDASYGVLSGLAGRADPCGPATPEQRAREAALWSFVHGYATLRMSGALDKDGRAPPGPVETFEALGGYVP